MPTIDELKKQAEQAYAQDRAAVAETICRQILQASPNDLTMHHLLGLACLRQGKNELAERHLSQTIALGHRAGEMYSHLATAQLGQRKIAEAKRNFEYCIQLQPTYLNAFIGLASLLLDIGDLAGSERVIRAAIQLNPNVPDTWNLLGSAVRLQGRMTEAAHCYGKAVELAPTSIVALNNMANMFQLFNRREPAMDLYRRVLAIDPAHAMANSNLAVLLKDLGHFEEAETHLRRAIASDPKLSDAVSNLGGILQGQARLREAMDCFRQADALNPRETTAFSNLLLCMNYDPAVDDAALLAEHKRFGVRFGAANPLAPAKVDRDPDRPLRIGYVSCDFRLHATAYFLQAIFDHHDRARYPIYGYSGVICPDVASERFQKESEGWRPTLNVSDQALAEQIRADQIDILVDLAGHTAQNRLRMFALRPAPIQVTYLGYPNTTGVPAIDYRLTDSVADPVGETSYYTEQLYRLPGPFSCFTQIETAPEVGQSPAQRDGRVTFASLNNLQRLNRRVLDTWSQIIRSVPNSRLLIFRDSLRGKLKDELHRYLTSTGIAASRLELGCTYPPGGHMAIYPGIDISLDTFPWSGHTTACQSLWMGAPVITLRGTRHAGRMVSSVLHHIGHDEWIAESREDYVAKAVALASDVGKLAEIRSGLRKTMQSSPMCDGPAFVQGLEAAYRHMWHRWLGK